MLADAHILSLGYLWWWFHFMIQGSNKFLKNTRGKNLQNAKEVFSSWMLLEGSIKVFMKNNIYNLATYFQDRAKESDSREVKKNKRLKKNSLLR